MNDNIERKKCKWIDNLINIIQVKKKRRKCAIYMLLEDMGGLEYKMISCHLSLGKELTVKS